MWHVLAYDLNLYIICFVLFFFLVWFYASVCVLCLALAGRQISFGDNKVKAWVQLNPWSVSCVWHEQMCGDWFNAAAAWMNTESNQDPELDPTGVHESSNLLICYRFVSVYRLHGCQNSVGRIVPVIIIPLWNHDIVFQDSWKGGKSDHLYEWRTGITGHSCSIITPPFSVDNLIQILNQQQTKFKKNEN